MRNLYFLSCLCLLIALSPFSFAQGPSFEAVYATIEASKVNVRAGQGVNFESLGQLDKGTQIVVLAEEYGWYKVKLPKNCQAYVHKDYVKGNVVSASSLRVRARAGIKSNTIGTLQKADQIVVRKQEGEWLLIVPPEKASGWIQKDYVKLSSQKYVPAPVEEAKIIPEKAVPETPKPPTTSPEKIAETPVAAPTVEVKTVTAPAPKDEFTGIIQDVGKFHKRPGAHKLVQDERTVYYLKSDTVNFNPYIYQRVRVVGKIQELEGLDYPLIEVTQIKAVAQ